LNILIIGSGGREHCLALKISQSSKVSKIFAIPGNGGIASLAQCHNIDIGPDSFDVILNFINEKNIDFTVVGPEAPLVDGLIDFLSMRGKIAFGPEKKAAQLEGSKIFTKNICTKYGIPTAGSVSFKRKQYEEAVSYAKNLKEERFPLVFKVDGLAAGKGVIITENKSELIECIKDVFINNVFKSSGDEIIIEQFLKGYEVSILCICDGNILIPMEPAQDYKRIFDNDGGKNTGGMGSYSPVPFLNLELKEKILNKIIFPTYDAIKKENILYKGILYAGIIVVENEPYLLEYNCRFGDPETQSVIPRLKNDIIDILFKAASGDLSGVELDFTDEKAVCIVAASKGYPQTSSSGDVIKGLSEAGRDKTYIFHAGTKKEGREIVTNGGRVLNVVSVSRSFKEAREEAYESMSKIKFDGMQYRKDIAFKVENF